MQKLDLILAINPKKLLIARVTKNAAKAERISHLNLSTAS
jgi:hypothetical protein